MHPKKRVAVLGTSNIDIINQVSRFAAADDEVYVEKTHQLIGGSGANFALSISELGIKTGILSSIGMDYWGYLISKQLSGARIDIGRIKAGNEKTGMSYIAVDGNGERSIYNYMGANADYEIENEDVKYIKDSDWLHLTGMYIEVVEEASKHAENLSFNPGTILSTYGLEKLENTIKKTRILFLNHKEFALLTGMDFEEGVAVLLEMGVEIVVITRGSSGALAFTKQDIISVSPPEVEVVDTTGAGDTFAAGFIASYQRDDDLATCLDIATQTAAQNLTHWGGNTKISNLEKL